ncbi:hypothetical protein ACTA71_000151 [Dictyostelium dimigraforme]
MHVNNVGKHHLKVKKECMTCRCEVKSINDLVTLDKDEINGCKEIMTVDQIGSHFQHCKFKFVTCQHKGCNKILRFRSLEEHQKQWQWILFNRYLESLQFTTSTK